MVIEDRGPHRREFIKATGQVVALPTKNIKPVVKSLSALTYPKVFPLDTFIATFPGTLQGGFQVIWADNLSFPIQHKELPVPLSASDRIYGAAINASESLAKGDLKSFIDFLQYEIKVWTTFGLRIFEQIDNIIGKDPRKFEEVFNIYKEAQDLDLDLVRKLQNHLLTRTDLTSSENKLLTNLNLELANTISIKRKTKYAIFATALDLNDNSNKIISKLSPRALAFIKQEKGKSDRNFYERAKKFNLDGKQLRAIEDLFDYFNLSFEKLFKATSREERVSILEKCLLHQVKKPAFKEYIEESTAQSNIESDSYGVKNRIAKQIVDIYELVKSTIKDASKSFSISSEVDLRDYPKADRAYNCDPDKLSPWYAGFPGTPREVWVAAIHDEVPLPDLTHYCFSQVGNDV